jgi:hypothetical protein
MMLSVGAMPPLGGAYDSARSAARSGGDRHGRGAGAAEVALHDDREVRLVDLCPLGLELAAPLVSQREQEAPVRRAEDVQDGVRVGARRLDGLDTTLPLGLRDVDSVRRGRRPGSTVSVAVAVVVPKEVAVMVTWVGADTAVVTTANVALVCPGGTTTSLPFRTFSWNPATAALLLDRLTTAPWEGDDTNVTVAVSPPPPMTVDGLSVTDFSAASRCRHRRHRHRHRRYRRRRWPRPARRTPGKPPPLGRVLQARATWAEWTPRASHLAMSKEPYPFSTGGRQKWIPRYFKHSVKSGSQQSERPAGHRRTETRTPSYRRPPQRGFSLSPGFRGRAIPFS